MVFKYLKLASVTQLFVSSLKVSTGSLQSNHGADYTQGPVSSQFVQEFTVMAYL